MAEARVERRLAAILAADVAGYSRLMGVDEEGTLAALKAHRRDLIDPKIAEHHGRMVKTTGDGALVEFASAVDAVRCAMEIQRAMAERNANVPEDSRIEIRIGVNVGDIIIDEGDIYGDGVNIAARVETLASPGAICISDNAYQQIKGKLILDVSDMGEHQLKNIMQRVRVYGVRLDGAPAAPTLALPEKPSIAVLPFINMSGDPEQEYFSDGMSEDIITALSKVKWFFVIARNSSFTYKGKTLDVKQVGRELGVRYVLEGSVRKAGNRVRITAQLINAISGAHVWAERYDRELADIFAVQDEITERVVAAIQPQLYAAEGIRAKRKTPESLDAWECVVRALSLMNTRAESDVDAARELLNKAIMIDPTYAQAHALFSFVTTLQVHLGWKRPSENLPLAFDSAQRAIALDSESDWGHVALGYMLLWSGHAADGFAEYEKALAHNPNFAIAHYLTALALCYLGRSEDALAHAEQAERLSPRDLLSRGNAGVFNNVRATACFVAGRYRDGISFSQKALAENPRLIPAYRILVINHALAGSVDEARAVLQRLKIIQPDFSLKWVEEVGLSPWTREEDRKRYFEAWRLVDLE